MEARRFVATLAATGLAYADFRRELETHSHPRSTILEMDEASSFPPKRGSDASYTRPPKRRGENRQQYRERLHASGVL